MFFELYSYNISSNRIFFRSRIVGKTDDHKGEKEINLKISTVHLIFIPKVLSTRFKFIIINKYDY